MTFDLLAVTIAKKVHHGGAMHMALESGGEIPFEGGLFALRIIPLPNNFCSLQLITKGVESNINYNVVRKPRVVKPKKKGLFGFLRR